MIIMVINNILVGYKNAYTQVVTFKQDVVDTGKPLLPLNTNR